MPTLAAEVVTMIQEIKGAIQNLNDSPDSNVAIKSYSLELKTTFESSAGSSAELDLWLIKVGVKTSLSQTLSLNFKLHEPESGFEKGASSVNAVLTRAGQVIDSALREASRGTSAFALSESSVQLQFVVSADGELKFGNAGVVVSASETNTIKVIFAAKDQK